MNFTPIQSEKDILPMHDSLEEWQLPSSPKTELEIRTSAFVCFTDR